MPAFYLLVLVKIAHSMNRFEFSLFGLTLPSLRRVASRPIPSRESSLFPISSHFFHRVCSASLPRGEGGFLDPRRIPTRCDATRHSASRRGAARRAEREARAKGVFPPCVPRAAARWDHHGDRHPHTFILRDISP